MKRKKLYRYMHVQAGEGFPATKARLVFKLPWRVSGKGLKNDTARQASGGAESPLK
jgi:hypothetical protein